MLQRISILALLAPLLSSCGSEEQAVQTDEVSEPTDTPDPAEVDEDDGALASQESGGGTTGDFSGTPSPCPATRQEGVDDEPTLGFSVSEILDAASGSFEFDAIWGAQCHFLPADRLENCGDEGNTPYLLDQVASHVTIEVTPTGEAATVVYQPEGALPCAQSMTIPVSATLHSDDALLDEPSVELELVTHCGDIVTLRHSTRLGAIQGALWGDAVGMDPGWEVHWDLSIIGNEAWFSLSIQPPGASTVIDLGDPANDAAVKTVGKRPLPGPDTSNLVCASR